MADESDDDITGFDSEPVPLSPLQRRHRVSPRVVSRVYRRAQPGLQAQMLACLLQPLNALSIAGVAAGAFAAFLDHRPRLDDASDLDAVTRYSMDQIAALTSFVVEVAPETIDTIGRLIQQQAQPLMAWQAMSAVFNPQIASSAQQPRA